MWLVSGADDGLTSTTGPRFLPWDDELPLIDVVRVTCDLTHF